MSPPDNVHNTMGKNTGSLPDLTCCHFPSPLDTPIDQEDRGPPYQPVSLDKIYFILIIFFFYKKYHCVGVSLVWKIVLVSW